jgi:tetratricopeptide (TPR) repeat protein
MARNVLRLIALLAVVVVFAGCSGGGSMVSVLRGNLAYSRGDYQSALVHYLSTDAESVHRGWLLYNSGNVYYALGEQEAALSAWDDARKSAVDPVSGEADRGAQTLLIHAASYNRGVLFYQRGEYQAAYDEFKYALSVNARSVAAKANLELALERVRSAEQVQQVGGDAANGDAADEAGPATLRILEYVRRKEAQRWFANRESDESHEPRDW